jgi:hypothetical protein
MHFYVTLIYLLMRYRVGGCLKVSYRAKTCKHKNTCFHRSLTTLYKLLEMNEYYIGMVALRQVVYCRGDGMMDYRRILVGCWCMLYRK